jgi:hypothetical protein
VTILIHDPPPRRSYAKEGMMSITTHRRAVGDTSTKARLPMLAPPLAALLCDRDSVTHCELRRNAWAICLFFERAEFKTDYSVPRLA